MKIYYAVAWAKDRTKTWSGTGYHLYEAFKKKGEVYDCSLQLNSLQKNIIKILHVNIVNGKFKSLFRFSKLEKNWKSKKLQKFLDAKGGQIPLIQLEDLKINYKDVYLYQDLSIDSLIWCKKNYPKYYEYSGFQENGSKDLRKKKAYQNAVYKKAKGIFTMGRWLAENLIEYSNIPQEKIHWVGGGINLDTSKIENRKRSNNKILFVGKDFKRKAGDLVYDAFCVLKEKYNPLAELYIIGPEKCPIENMIEGVYFLGYMKSDELSQYFNECDIFCMPSRFEAYGLVFVEALVYGLPCIGRNAFEMKYFIEDGETGYLIEDDDVEILAKKMDDLLKNDTIKANVLNKREQYIYDYSWDTVVERMCRYF